MKKKFYLLILLACFSFIGTKAQNYPGYQSPCPPTSICPGYLGILAYAHVDLDADEFVFERTFSRDIDYVSLPFGRTEIRGGYLRLVLSKADFHNYILNPAVKNQQFYDVTIWFRTTASSPYWGSSGQQEWGCIMLMWMPR